jgi:hypothetical protein
MPTPIMTPDMSLLGVLSLDDFLSNGRAGRLRLEFSPALQARLLPIWNIDKKGDPEPEIQ